MFFEGYDDRRLAGQLSGERFQVDYLLEGDLPAAEAMARDICGEQTVEFPLSVIPAGAILDRVVGRIESLEQVDDRRCRAAVSYAAEIAAGEFTQFLNVVFGNISIKPGIQVAEIRPSPAILGMVKGPRFGIPGIRERIGVPERAPVFTALKPMGLSAADLAALAGQFARGGVDIIKDDHGLTDQAFAPFKERVRRCAAAVQEENARTGRKAIYVPNVTGPVDRLRERAHKAKEWGAGGLLVAPGLVGLDALRALAEDDALALPLFAHPAFIGSYAVNPQGIACRVLFGTLMRMAGADATSFPTSGGRFSLTVEECLGVARAGKEPLGGMKPIFPAPAGGMQLQNVGEIVSRYGRDVLVLVGGGLFTCGDDLVDNCRRFLEAVEPRA